MKGVRIPSFISVILFIALVSAASAHAKADHCKPEPGSASPTAPSEVRCWFTEEIDTKTSTLIVIDASGQRADNNDARVDLNDPDHKQLFATLKLLSTGVYQVAWHVVSTDDNAITEGTWYFGVGQVTVPTLAPQSANPPAPPSVAASATDPAGLLRGAIAGGTTGTPSPTATPAVQEATAPSGVSDSRQTYVVVGLVLLGAAAIALIARQVLG